MSRGGVIGSPLANRGAESGNLISTRRGEGL